MCFSAQIEQRLKKFERDYSARVQTELFTELFERRARGEKLRINRGLAANFLMPKTEIEQRAFAAIKSFEAAHIAHLREDQALQTKRFRDAEAKLITKPTKKTDSDRGIAQRKLQSIRQKLASLESQILAADDSRIYAFDWAPVMIYRDGERQIVPMRYHLRPFGATEDFDRNFSGCYNARRDSLTGFWKKQFGKTHAVLIATKFFENVNKHDYEKRKLQGSEIPSNLVIEFAPQGFSHMLIACLWDRWAGPSAPELKSFALITDDPPLEVAETGHNRCPIFLKEKNLDLWLNPQGKSQAELFQLLSDKEQPFYQHRLAA